MSDTDYVRLDSGEIGIVDGYGSPKVGKTFVMYFSLETSRRRRAYFDEDNLKHISREEFIKILKGDEYKSAYESHSRRKYKERDSYIYEQRNSGRTYKSIADEFNLTSQRVMQICNMEARRRRNA